MSTLFSSSANTALATGRMWHKVDIQNRTLGPSLHSLPPLLLFPHQAEPPDVLPTHLPSGKVAARIAVVLMGKHKPVFDRGSASSFVLSVSLSGLLLRAFA